jgi:di/tricarboxylate transporter
MRHPGGWLPQRVYGVAALIGDHVVQLRGAAGPRAALAGLFIVTTAVTQCISNTSAALVMSPVATATAAELGISPLPLLIGVAMGAGASHLTPISTPVNLLVHGPGGYEFGAYRKLGLIAPLWSLLVAVFTAPIYWRF